MTNTKKSFMSAGAILGIVTASFMILASIVCFYATTFVDVQFIIETLEEEAVGYKTEEIKFLVDTTKTVLVVMGVFILGLAIAMLSLSIMVQTQTKKLTTKKGSIIALLVICCIAGNILTAAFMIVVLCLKDKTAEQLVEENMPKNN